MSGTPTSGQLITSEQVLERLFRAGYERWIADAKKRLGPEGAMSAPRVVSKVFHLAWTDRARFQTQEELDAFLGANIQHQSARELSRKASAQHLGGKAGEHKDHAVHEMTIEEAWDRLKHTLQGGAPEAYRQRASNARHEAAGHMANLGKEKFNWKPLAAIGGVGLVIALAIYFYVDVAGADRAIQHALNAQDVRAYETSFGQQANVGLDDSTAVRLGPESKLVVPKMFGLGLRSVKIEGAANFDVRQQLDEPFEVRASGIVIQAVGTTFTVRYYKSDPAVYIHARQGALSVRVGAATRKVAEGMALKVEPTGAMSVPTSEELSEASSWVDGKASILNRDLKEALPLLKRWYGLDIHVQDTTLLSRRVYVNADSKKTAIAAVEQSGGMRFTYVGENMVFQDTLPSRGGKRTTKK